MCGCLKKDWSTDGLHGHEQIGFFYMHGQADMGLSFLQSKKLDPIMWWGLNLQPKDEP